MSGCFCSDILVCLVTVHAESYGNRAISGFRIVENKNSIYAKKQNIVQQSQNRKSALQQMQRSYAQLHPVAQQQISLHQQGKAFSIVLGRSQAFQSDVVSFYAKASPIFSIKTVEYKLIVYIFIFIFVYI